ncbi:MAG: hypothetical protein N3E36_01700 [Sulfolobales archaeon]|nr:hypothetical protein [Sulfolobales archaeon]MCX8198729.1 hypothetical protein [Sulfolobales archaeon]MDW8169802.1 hypothetical protein [Desulfurococcaceae archaeon]
MSFLLEEMIKEELMLNLENAASEFTDLKEVELDFEPVKLLKDLVNTLIREMKDEEEGSLFRQQHCS